MSVLFKQTARGVLCLGWAFVLMGCAGEKSDLEEARYSMGKGDAQKASELVTPLLESSDIDVKLEAYQVYAGSQIVLAGFDSSKVVGALIFPGEGSSGDKETVKLINTIATLTDSSAGILSAANTKVGTFVASSEYDASTNTRGKSGVKFELGLVQFFKALRSAIQDTGFSSATFSPRDCVTSVSGKVEQIAIDLGSSRDNLTSTSVGLDSNNDLVKLIDSLKKNADNATNLCSYINDQRPTAQ